MDSTIGGRTPPPRLVKIQPPRPQSMGTSSSINPKLLSRRRRSRSHNYGTVDTVPELRRFNSSGTKSSMKTRPRQTTSQSYGSLDTTSPRRERETMKDISDFLMSYDPPGHNMVAPPQTSPRRKFGLLRRKKKKESKANQLLRLPDTAISAKTRQGVKYIAISIPLEHDHLGRSPTSNSIAASNNHISSQLVRTPILDRAPVVVHKPVYNLGGPIPPPLDPPSLERGHSNSKRSTWGPGTLTKVITKPGSEQVMLQNGYIHRTSQVYTPTASIYHNASETKPKPNSSNAAPSSGPPFRVTLTDNHRTNSLSSVSRPILWRHRSNGPLRVINRTPSPDIKPTYQTHKVLKSISTIHSIATTGTGIRQSLKSTPDSLQTNSSATPAVFGTAETIDLQSFRATTARPALALPRTGKLVEFPVVSPELESAPAYQASSPMNILSPKSPQIGSNEKQADQAAQIGRREKVRARKERDLASLRSKNSNLDKTNSNEMSTQSIPDPSPAGPSCPSSTNTKSIESPAAAGSSEQLSQKAVVLSISNIMLVADLPPFVEQIHQSDLVLQRHLSPVPSIPSPSRLPRPSFTPAESVKMSEKGKSVYVHHSTQTSYTSDIPGNLSCPSHWHESRHTRPNSEAFVYPRLDLEGNGYEGGGFDGLDMAMDVGREKERERKQEWVWDWK